ncbi:immunoglobulin lambda-1 light chain-like isoform X8 [Dendrobates tinctorius]|uniref:immunoglobulin lambda-1 light chain-like isoform X8 n=1 Tax=Dendrobates tinctorius TaxID=92724 RepID=UPI003CC9320F
MFWSSLCVVLVVSCTSGLAQHVLTQEKMISASLNERVTFSCHLNTGTVSDTNYPYWLQQKSGQVPRVLIYNTNARPSGIPDRFSGSKSGNFAYLTISAVKAEDDADYYCLMWFSGAALFGEGTQLIVLTGEVKTPSVFIYGPSEEELKNDKATMVCAIRAYTPRTLSVEWTVDGTKWTSGVQTSTESKQADNLYMKSSLFSLSTSEYNKHEEYGCKVIHQNKEIIQTFKRSECH